MTTESKPAKPPVIGKVTTERRGRIFLIGIDRREKLNSFDPTMHHLLRKAYGEYQHDPDLWCAVVFGHGDNFTSGLDLVQFADAMKDGSRGNYAEDEIDFCAISGPRLTKPVVSAVQGYCYTIGLELMLATDVRIAAKNTRFAMLEVKRGIHPTGGGTIRLMQEMGWGNAMRYLLTGDEFYAEDAYRMGIVQEVVEVGQQLDRAIEVAEKIAANAPLAVQYTMRSSRVALLDGEEAAKKRFRTDQMELAKTEDAQEGVRAFVERRPGRWQGR
jgi:enoyl-CoA hydratase